MSPSVSESILVQQPLPRNAYFLIGDRAFDQEVVKNFAHRLRVSGFTLFHNFDDIQLLEKEQATLAILGHCYNPFDGTTGDETARHLSSALSGSESEFLDYLDQLGGRFVVLLSEANGDVATIADACATLPVCYHADENGLCLSSHSSLIKAALGLENNELMASLSQARFYHMGIRHCPGELTEVEGVKMLSPNQQLSFTKGSGALSLKRIFPRGARQEKSLDEVVEQVAEGLRRSMHCLVSHGKPMACALSGGVDSRVSLSATSDLREHVRFFTFAGKGNAERDLECTRELASRLKLDFTPVTLPQEVRDDDFIARYLFLQGETRAPNARETLQRMTHFGCSDGFEIRSSVSEVARSFMKRKFHVDQLPMMPAVMVPLYKRVPFSRYWHGRLEEVFADWVKRTNFSTVVESGYEWLDFYYWEFRVGSWQSLVLQDADYYTNPTVIFANRKLLELMLSVPEKYRQNDELQKRIMLALDNRVLDVPLVKNFGRKAALREVVESSYFLLYRTVMC